MTRNIYQRTVLAAVILFTFVDVCQPCIPLLDGWKQKSVGERAKLAKVVFVGKTVRRYPSQRMVDQTEVYAADFKIIRLFKGQQIIEEILEMYPSPYVKVYGFGEKRRCLVEVYPGETYLVFMVYHNSSRMLIARYDDIFGATAPATEENQNEILAEIGELCLRQMKTLFVVAYFIMTFPLEMKTNFINNAFEKKTLYIFFISLF